MEFGEAGTGDGQFSWDIEIGNFIAAGPANTIYVGDKGRVEEFEADGSFVKSIPVPGEAIQGLAVDPSGNIYLALFKELGVSKEDVRKLDPAGNELCRASVKNPRAIATDAAGNLYVADGVKGIGGVEMTLRKFDPACKEVADGRYPFADGFDGSTGIATNTVTQSGEAALYVSNAEPSNSYVRAYYPPPDKPAPFDQPPQAAPTIASQYAVATDAESASVRAQINPRFFADTSYYVEYGTGECSKGGCATQPLAPGTQLGAGRTSEDVTSGAILLSGLQPATTYHFRFVAQSSGGGPVYGIDPDAEGPGEASFEEGLEGTFNTFPATVAPAACPNDAFRGGPGANLPKCRAYELVSPLDKNNGDIEVLDGSYTRGYGEAVFARIDQASPEGERITFSATRAFGAPESAPWSSQYLAARDPQSGWSSRTISPPRGNLLLNGETNTNVPFKGFTEDLCGGWYLQETNLQQVAGAPPGVPNLYRRGLCGGDGFEAVTGVAPPGFSLETEPLSSGGSKYFPEIQGFSADGAHSLVRANATLSTDASSKDRFQLYETSPGPEGVAQMTLISLLPSGLPAPTHASLGTSANAGAEFRNDSVNGAVSADGSRIFWSASTASDSEAPSRGGGGTSIPQPGNLYLRANPLAEKSTSGKCDETGKACTLAIAPANSEFWSANPAGSLVIYQTAGKLFEARIEEAGESLVSTSTQIADGVVGVMGTSEDASKVYFTSTKALAGGAVEGKPNLYLHEAGAPIKLVASLGPLDSSHVELPALDNIKPDFRRARVSPDGAHAAFLSYAPLTGFDNTDANSGEPDSEVFLYDAGANEGAGALACISCNPGGVRPSGRMVGDKDHGTTQIWAAAQLPAWEDQHHAARALAPDGSHLFFESYDSLLPADTNGARDVYEWQRAGSQKGCEEARTSAYVPSAGGCLSLISTGKSPQDSEFIDASADGRDVFFTTRESLIEEDPGLIDIYDARIGGGFAPKPTPPACQGEACQPQSPAPADQVPSSTSYTGPGNQKPAKPKSCPKGKHKVKKHGKSSCVKNKKKAKANKTGRPQR